MGLNVYEECNVMIGELLGMPRVLVDLPGGYAGKDYLKDWGTLRSTLKDVIKKVNEEINKRDNRIKELEQRLEDEIEVWKRDE